MVQLVKCLDCWCCNESLERLAIALHVQAAGRGKMSNGFGTGFVRSLAMSLIAIELHNANRIVMTRGGESHWGE